jgi:hypothetical protein
MKIKKKEKPDEIRYWFDIHKFALGKLMWSEFQYYTCSPYMFIAACEGYFDKEENEMLIHRKVAQVMWGAQGGKPHEFDKFWPLPRTAPATVRVWGSPEERALLKKQIEQAHGIKLS